MAESGLILHSGQAQGWSFWHWLFGCVAVTLFSCASTEDAYLAQVTNHATQAEILQHFGQPTLKQGLDTGGSVWVYRWEPSPIGARDFSPVCREIHLTFDTENVLRRWGKQRC